MNKKLILVSTDCTTGETVTSGEIDQEELSIEEVFQAVLEDVMFHALQGAFKMVEIKDHSFTVQLIEGKVKTELVEVGIGGLN